MMAHAFEGERVKISVCMATFNGEKYLREQISSILGQLSETDELIVSDDFSTDDTLNIARSFKDARIKVISNKLTKGYSSNFENAIRCATGDIIFLSDQDDVWLPGRVDLMVNVLQSASMVVCNAEYVDQFLCPLNRTLIDVRGLKNGFWRNLYRFQYLGACMAFRRSVATKALPFPANKYLCPHDMWLALIGELFFDVTSISQVQMLYRRHDGAISTGGLSARNGLLRMVQFRLYAVLMLIKRFFGR